MDEGNERAALATDDQRREAVEPCRAARVDADRLCEIDVAAEAREQPVVPVAAPVLHPDAALAIGAPVAARRVARENDSRLGADLARRLGGALRPAGVRDGKEGVRAGDSRSAP